MPNAGPVRPKRLSALELTITAVLLVIPLVALGAVPLYAKDGPRLWGFPFFYWYQFLWVFLASACTCAAYLVISRARRTESDR